MRRRPRFDRRGPKSSYPDPNRPGSPDYAERHRRKVWECIPGMTRIDMGGKD
ncbi:hypothetical protein [Tsuneonella mangrovi]|uniref:hypothetical protein n=1 Tax=Tsuneonella mangrovi TaxID=1982042 RepID=UPI001471E412|nr:hypothetical protein [Tsuneonella mangrovi]